MASFDLTSSQKSLLTALVNLYRDRETAIKGEAIAEEIDRAPGTIRNQMQTMKALHLVESIFGPKGGYKPTAATYEALEIGQLDQPATVPVRRNADLIDGANVEEISLTSVQHPERCRAEIRIHGSFRDFQQGDKVRVGPTPLLKLVIDGVLEGTDETNSIAILEIEGMSIGGSTT